ncbi:hypothetical protein M758_9G109400 [Ceratodon purpureus]|nr:hypothetical protein M758_9G109400 [Ceratodon purpureus]
MGRFGSAFLLAVTLFAAILAGTSAAVCNAADKQSLLAFKSQLLDPKNALAAWTSSSDCCKWTEIQCNPSGRVTGLFLGDTFSAPNLPSGYQLKVKKGIQGAGAPLGNLKELTELFLRRVAFGFVYPIPPQLSNLLKLRRLSLLDCEFIGPIPSTIGNLVQLTDLVINNNRLSGPAIPDTFGKLKALRTLSIVNNGLTSLGSQKLTLLKNLETVDLGNNKFSGGIPKWLGGLTLSSPISATLILSGNPFTGPIPGELCNIKGLISLYIANTRVTAIPAQIGNCQSLKVLYLVNNKLRGSLPAGMGKLQKLQTLALGSDNKNFNRMTGTLPAALGDLPDMGDFDIANNDFSGRIPANYGPFSIFKVPIEMTRFQGNNLSGPIPASLKDVPADRFRPGNPGLCGTPLPAC